MNWVEKVKTLDEVITTLEGKVKAVKSCPYTVGEWKRGRTEVLEELIDTFNFRRKVYNEKWEEEAETEYRLVEADKIVDDSMDTIDEVFNVQTGGE